MGHALLENAWTVTAIAQTAYGYGTKERIRVTVISGAAGKAVVLAPLAMVTQVQACVRARAAALDIPSVNLCTRTGRIVRSCICYRGLGYDPRP